MLPNDSRRRLQKDDLVQEFHMQKQQLQISSQGHTEVNWMGILSENSLHLIWCETELKCHSNIHIFVLG